MVTANTGGSATDPPPSPLSGRSRPARIPGSAYCCRCAREHPVSSFPQARHHGPCRRSSRAAGGDGSLSPPADRRETSRVHSSVFDANVSYRPVRPAAAPGVVPDVRDLASPPVGDACKRDRGDRVRRRLRGRPVASFRAGRSFPEPHQRHHHRSRSLTPEGARASADRGIGGVGRAAQFPLARAHGMAGTRGDARLADGSPRPPETPDSRCHAAITGDQ